MSCKCLCTVLLTCKGAFIPDLHASIWRPDICIWQLFFTNYYLLAPFLKICPLKQVFRGHFGPQVKFSGWNTVSLQQVFSLCKWRRDWFLKKLIGQVDIAKCYLTKKVSLNSKEQGNCLVSWWTQSSHWRNTGHLWLSSWFCPWPHLSAKRWPNSNHSRVTKTWNP